MGATRGELALCRLPRAAGWRWGGSGQREGKNLEVPVILRVSVSGSPGIQPGLIRSHALLFRGRSAARLGRFPTA